MSDKRKSLRDLSGIFGGLTGGAVKALSSRRSRLDAMEAAAMGGKPKKKVKQRRATK